MFKTNLSIAVIAAITSSTVFAQSQQTIPNSADSNIETLIVTGNRYTQSSFDVLAAVSTFDRQDIEILQPINVADLVAKTAGISVAKNGGNGQNSSLFVRGSNSEHVLILIDGIRVGSATTGKKSLSSISVAMVERIEVIRGPQAAIWGSDAIGGVIQIFTRNYASAGELNITVGSQDYRTINVASGIDLGATNLTAAISHEAEHGYDVKLGDDSSSDSDGFEKNAIQIKSTTEINKNLTLTGLVSQDKSFIEYDDGVTNSVATLLKASLAYTTDDVSLNLNVANSKDDARSISAYPSRFITSREQLNASLFLTPIENISVVTGIDGFKDKVSGTTDFSTKSRQTIGGFVSIRSNVSNIIDELTLRRDNVENVSTENTYNWSLGYEFDNAIVAYKQSTGFRAPTFNNLYSPEKWGSIGNPDLDFETSLSREVILKYRSNKVNLSFSVFETQFNNLIQYNDPDGWQGPVLASYFNISESSAKGAELEIQYTTKNVELKNTLAYTAAVNEITDTDLLLRPRWTNLTSLTLKTSDKSSYLIEADLRADSIGYGDVAIEGYTLVNIGFNHHVSKSLLIKAHVDNLLDHTYETAAGYLSPGVTLQLGINYKF